MESFLYTIKVTYGLCARPTKTVCFFAFFIKETGEIRMKPVNAQKAGENWENAGIERMKMEMRRKLKRMKTGLKW